MDFMGQVYKGEYPVNGVLHNNPRHPAHPRLGRGKYPFNLLDVGDYFDVRIEDGNTVNNVRCCLHQYTKTKQGEGKRFHTQQTQNHVDQKVLRVWRRN